MNESKLRFEAVLRELRNHLPQFERLYGVTKIGIFGSVARDDASEGSDVDIVYEMSRPNLFYGSAFERRIGKYSALLCRFGALPRKDESLSEKAGVYV